MDGYIHLSVKYYDICIELQSVPVFVRVSESYKLLCYSNFWFELTENFMFEIRLQPVQNEICEN